MNDKNAFQKKSHRFVRNYAGKKDYTLVVVDNTNFNLIVIEVIITLSVVGTNFYFIFDISCLLDELDRQKIVI
ncbi:hypothetical protein ATN88_08560 [Enterovibrio coralii]|uniref:Uncharacterized protein n=1 Tax=Enterovibrio coralii TaxID=294935 RepID=A0A135I5K8_9GAMM|nr:hypothetical protein ATN88_08560 [Enterovibrio coralii]